MIFPDDEKDSPEIKRQKKKQKFVCAKVGKIFQDVLKDLRKQSQLTAQRAGALQASVESVLSPYFSTGGSMGFSGGSTKLSDGRYIFVSLCSCHYGVQPDSIEIIFCKSEKITEGTTPAENTLGSLKIESLPGKLDFNEVANALRVMADAIDQHQYVPGANSDFVAFSHMFEQTRFNEKM